MAIFGKEALKAVLDGKADIGTVAETPIMLEDETRWAMKTRLTDRKDMPDDAQHLDPEALKTTRAAMPSERPGLKHLRHKL